MKKNYILLFTLLISALSFGQVAGDIIITEIMQNPAAVSDNVGEYFEIYNTTGSSIDMNGWIISDNGSNSHTIVSSLVVPANGYLVLGVNTDTATNGNVPVDYSYGGDIGLSNGDDELILTTAGAVEIDRVEWDGGPNFPDPNGKSMNLDNSQYTYTANDDGANWCESTTAMGTQFGTPGADNTSCAVPCDLNLGERDAVCDAFTDNTDTYTASVAFSGGATSTYVINTTEGTVSGDNPTDIADGVITISGIAEGTDFTLSVDNLTVGGTCDLSADITSPICIPAACEAVGSIIFTEIMQNPDAVDDNFGEWFEIYNTTGGDIELQGWSIVDDSHSLYEEGFVIPNSLIIPANGYLLFANNGNTGTNGGLPTPDYVYDYVDLTLGNGTDGITIQCLGTIIDEVIWDNGVTFPDPSGASMSLDVAMLNATDNDDGTNWTTVSFTYGDGDNGTPGAVNDTQLSVVQNQIDGFSIYPNPVVNGSINLQTLNATTKDIMLYNVLGKLVYTNSFSRTNSVIDLSNLNTGIYIIKVVEGTNVATRKLVIQ